MMYASHLKLHEIGQRLNEGLASIDGRFTDTGIRIDRIAASVKRIDDAVANTNERIDGFEASVNERFDSVNKRMDDGFSRMDKRFDDAFSRMDKRFDDAFRVIFLVLVVLAIVAAISLRK